MIQTRLIHNWLDHWCIWLTLDLINAMQWMCLVISWVNWDKLTRQQQNMYWDIYEAQLDMAWDMPPVWTWVCRICRFRLSRKYSEPEEQIWLIFYYEVCHGFLMQQETKLCSLDYHRGIVYSIECAKQCGFTSFWQIYLTMRWILWWWPKSRE